MTLSVDRVEVLFFAAAGYVMYTYLVYPVAVAVLSALFPQPIRRIPGYAPSVSVVIALKNEERRVTDRISNLLNLDYPPELLQIIAVSDGSTDSTPVLLRELSQEYQTVQAIVLEESRGKAAALNHGLTAATGSIVVFADARQTFAADAIRRLAEDFSDPSIGSVSGELEFSDEASGIAEPIGWYWRYEKWIRANESLIASMLGATGAIYAIRRDGWRPLPEDLILDDFIVPMRIVLQGRRAVFDRRAVAFDQRSQRTEEEFARKVRTLAGNYQAFATEPGVLIPWRNPTTWFQIWSHKVFRLLAPFALIITFFTSAVATTPAILALFVAQAVFYSLALIGLVIDRTGRRIRLRIVSFPLIFATMQAAALLALIHWMACRDLRQIWRPGSP